MPHILFSRIHSRVVRIWANEGERRDYGNVKFDAKIYINVLAGYSNSKWRTKIYVNTYTLLYLVTWAF